MERTTLAFLLLSHLHPCVVRLGKHATLDDETVSHVYRVHCETFVCIAAVIFHTDILRSSVLPSPEFAHVKRLLPFLGDQRRDL